MNVRHRNDETIRLGCGTGNATQLTQKPKTKNLESQKCKSVSQKCTQTKTQKPNTQHTNTQTHKHTNQNSINNQHSKHGRNPRNNHNSPSQPSSQQTTRIANRHRTKNGDSRFRDSETPRFRFQSRQVVKIVDRASQLASYKGAKCNRTRRMPLMSLSCVFENAKTLPRQGRTLREGVCCVLASWQQTPR